MSKVDSSTLDFAFQRLRTPGTWTTAALVGTLINVYGQLIVPWLRGSPSPVRDMARVWEMSPGVVSLSVALGYLFPLTVSLLSATATWRHLRCAVSRAEFPDHKPDPVFRALTDGTIVEVGASTARWMADRGLTRAQDILGAANWSAVVSSSDACPSMLCRKGDDRFVVRRSKAGSDRINVYVTELPHDIETTTKLEVA